MYVCVDRKTQTTKGLWAFLFHFEHEPSFSSFFFFAMQDNTYFLDYLCWSNNLSSFICFLLEKGIEFGY